MSELRRGSESVCWVTVREIRGRQADLRVTSDMTVEQVALLAADKLELRVWSQDSATLAQDGVALDPHHTIGLSGGRSYELVITGGTP